MLFNSFEFVFVFLPVVIILFFGTAKIFGRTSAKLFLITASIFFYGYWNIKFIPLILISLLVNYFTAREIQNAKDANKKYFLIAGITFNILLLGYFKYAKFFVSMAGIIIPDIILPLGISFFTFSQTAFLINNFNGSIKNFSLLNYSEFVLFFPYVTSGPITDFRDVNTQFDDNENFTPDYDSIAVGLNLFIIGLFKKTVIADGLAQIVMKVFASTDTLTFFEAWIGALGYSFQLYFDFSGYSDMAIALALMLNIELPENFNAPYKSTSIIEFWRRWHITLGAWIREYIYIPLGGNRHGEFNKLRNLFIAMLFTGLWHGAGWTFILWGALHGVMLIVNNLWRKLKITLPKFLSWLLTFMSVVISWMIFRAESVDEAFKIISAMFDFNKFILPVKFGKYFKFLEHFGFSFDDIHLFVKPCILYVLLVLVTGILYKNMSKIKYSYKFIFMILIWALWSFCNFSEITDFLYFKF